MPAKSTIRIGSIVIDCNNFERMMSFWQEALHYVPREPHEDGWVVLKDPQGKGPNVSISRTPEPRPDDYRLHLDLYAEDQDAEVKRLMRLGAKMIQPAEEGKDYVTLADPDGNPFDVVQIPRSRLMEQD